MTILQVGDFVDAQDVTGKWYEGVVRELTPDTVKVHYMGWSSMWDTDLPRRASGVVGGSNVRSLRILRAAVCLLVVIAR